MLGSLKKNKCKQAVLQALQSRVSEKVGRCGQAVAAQSWRRGEAMVDPLPPHCLAQRTPRSTTTAITADKFGLDKFGLNKLGWETPNMALETSKHLSPLNSLIPFENSRSPVKAFQVCTLEQRTMQDHRWLWTALSRAGEI